MLAPVTSTNGLIRTGIVNGLTLAGIVIAANIAAVSSLHLSYEVLRLMECTSTYPNGLIPRNCETVSNLFSIALSEGITIGGMEGIAKLSNKIVETFTKKEIFTKLFQTGAAIYLLSNQLSFKTPISKNQWDRTNNVPFFLIPTVAFAITAALFQYRMWKK